MIFEFLGFGKRSKPLVLHADDSALVVATTKALLQQLGCDVINAMRGEECIQLAKKHKPDLILLDAMMPGINGYQTVQAIRMDPATRSIPVVMLTGNDAVRDVEKAQDSGANGYLVKPLNIDRLQAKLQEFIRLPKRN